MKSEPGRRCLLEINNSDPEYCARIHKSFPISTAVLTNQSNEGLRDVRDIPSQSDHDHGHGTGRSGRKLALVAAINVVGFFAELAGGLLFGSVALLSDAVHMLFDALAYVIAFAAAYVASEYDTSDRWSYGLHRLEPLSAFLNGVLLVPMVAFVLYESYGRFLDPVAIATVPTLAIAVGGLCVNALRCTFWRATR